MTDVTTPTAGGTRSSNGPNAAAPIVLRAGEGEALWFLGCLVTIKAAGESTAGRVAVIEHLAPWGAGSPLRVQHNEHEWFYVCEGSCSWWSPPASRASSARSPSGPVSSRSRPP